MSQPLQSDNQRQLDLLRFCRHELHTQGLITDTEYSDLMQMSGSVARLGSYDEVRAKANADVLAERERCAKIAEGLVDLMGVSIDPHTSAACAARFASDAVIRIRSGQ